MKWGAIADCMGLKGDVRRPNMGVEVRVDAVEMEWGKGAGRRAGRKRS